jgi:hypothetical protein
MLSWIKGKGRQTESPINYLEKGWHREELADPEKVFNARPSQIKCALHKQKG